MNGIEYECINATLLYVYKTVNNPYPPIKIDDPFYFPSNCRHLISLAGWVNETIVTNPLQRFHSIDLSRCVNELSANNSVTTLSEGKWAVPIDYLLLIYDSIRSLDSICKYRDSNMFGNHFRILNARMVQSVESVWTVLKFLAPMETFKLPEVLVYF